MDLNLPLKEVITLIDLMTKLSWGAIPIWLSLTIPIIYITFYKLMPQRNTTETTESQPKKFTQKIKEWFSLPQIDTFIIYLSLFLFVSGTITLKIDQSEKERIRNTGLRMKEYFLIKNSYQVSKNTLVDGKNKLSHVTEEDINRVLELYPREFLEVDTNTIVLCDSHYTAVIMQNSERLLDNFLSNRNGLIFYKIDSLFSENKSFTRDVVYNLIIDSTSKYTFHNWTFGKQKIAMITVNR